MTVGRKYAIRIATLCDWLKNLAPVFQPISRKTKPIAARMRDFSRVLSKLHVIGRNFDWFMAPLAHVVIGRSN